MSRNFAVLGKAGAAAASAKASAERVPFERGRAAADPIPQYSELIRRLFQDGSVAAVVGSGFDGVIGICDSIAAELAASGKRTVVVHTGRLVRMSPAELGAETTIVPGSATNIWHWPSPPDRQIEFFRSHYPVKIDTGKWLDFLRRNFDCVLLGCQPLELQNQELQELVEANGITEIASAADAAVLAVEAGQTARRQIQRDQRALQSRGVRLAGCILIRKR
jgi:hypothetical protein